MAEASLELSNFLEPHSEMIKRLPAIYKRVVLGPIVDENCDRRRATGRFNSHVAAPA